MTQSNDPETNFHCQLPGLLTAEISVDPAIWHHSSERPGVRLTTLNLFQIVVICPH